MNEILKTLGSMDGIVILEKGGGDGGGMEEAGVRECEKPLTLHTKEIPRRDISYGGGRQIE
jgi:hypothetical protein